MAVARMLLHEEPPKRPVRLLGIGIAKLRETDSVGAQLALDLLRSKESTGPTGSTGPTETTLPTESIKMKGPEEVAEAKESSVPADKEK